MELGSEPGQVMEVVEHILHFVSDVGLHYTFPNEWGISKKSKLWEAMQEAVEKGYYDISSYADIDEENVRDRVTLSGIRVLGHLHRLEPSGTIRPTG